MYAVYTTPYYDKSKQIYMDILIVEPRPAGKVRDLTRQITLPDLTPNACNHCQTSICVYALKKGDHELMSKEDMSQLMHIFNKEEFQIETQLTEMILHTGVTPKNKRLVCYFTPQVTSHN